MPSYDYQCTKCGEIFGYLVSADIRDIKRDCPKPMCKGKLERTIIKDIAILGMDKMGRSKGRR